jgi:hypothetical protein
MTDDSEFKTWLRNYLLRRGEFLEDYPPTEYLVEVVDSWVLPKSGPINNDFKAKLLTVLVTMPEEPLHYLIKGRILRFHIAYGPAFTCRPLSNCHFIWIKPESFVRGNHNDKIYTIAHELAHVYQDYPSGYPDEQSELEADKLVLEWGFEKELRACPESYLYGYGLDRFRVEYSM